MTTALQHIELRGGGEGHKVVLHLAPKIGSVRTYVGVIRREGVESGHVEVDQAISEALNLNIDRIFAIGQTESETHLLVEESELNMLKES